VEFILATIYKDLGRWRLDAAGLAIWISIPLLIGGLITSLIGTDDGARPHGILLVTDLDDSFVSGIVVGAYTQGELGELISVEKVSEADGKARIDAGDASGFLVIPAGFGDALLDAEPVTLTLITNPAQSILPGIITDVTEILLDAGFYIHELFGPEIRTIRQQIDTDESPDNLFVSDISVAINEKMQEVGAKVLPPAIDIEVVDPAPTGTASASLALLYLPGIILMALVLSANGIAHDYWVEREQGTLRRLVVSPGRMTGFLIGKAVAAGVVITLVGGISLVIGFLYHDIRWSSLPPALTWTGIAGIALFTWFGVLQMLAGSERSATVISSMFVFPLLMAGGSFFPFAALPGWIAEFGRMTPNGFMADRLTTELTAEAAWSIDVGSWLIVIAMAVAGLVACGWRLRSGFARA
jgi:ABC-type Na+ efflux pump permease subunit